MLAPALGSLRVCRLNSTLPVRKLHLRALNRFPTNALTESCRPNDFPLNRPHARSFWWGRGSSAPATSPESIVSTPSSPAIPSHSTPEASSIDTVVSAPSSPSLQATSAPASPVAVTTSLESTPPAVPTIPFEDTISTLPDATSTFASIAEPTLQSLNMYSIWPRGLLVRLHEFIHLDLGFGWVSTIVIGALVCRIIVLPFAIKTMRMSLAMAKIQPKLAPLQEKISAASAKGDTNQMLATRKEMMLLFEQNKVSPLGGLWGFAQIPVMIGQFMAVRSMMQVGLPSMKDTGLQNVLDPLIHSGIWLKDLTIPDPIYLVPILSTALINLQLKLASRDQDMVNRPVAGHMLNIFSLLSVVGCLFLSRLPLGLNIALLCGSLFTIVQTLVFRIPPIRKWLGILPVPQYLRDSSGKLVKNKRPTTKETVAWARESVSSMWKTSVDAHVKQVQSQPQPGKKRPKRW